MNVKNCCFIKTCKAHNTETYKTAKIPSVTSRAVDIIKTVYYMYGSWRDRRNFCCFICVNYGPYTRTTVFFTFITNLALLYFTSANSASVFHIFATLLWPPSVADADIIFLHCGFFLPLFSSPNLSGRTLDVYHTSTHDVALVRI